MRKYRAPSGISKFINLSNIKYDWKETNGGGRYLKLESSRIYELIYDNHGLSNLRTAKFQFEFQCNLNRISSSFRKKKTFIAVDIPYVELVPLLTKAELSSVAAEHQIIFRKNLDLQSVREIMLNHSCVKCIKKYTIMNVVYNTKSRECMKYSRKLRSTIEPSFAMVAANRAEITKKAKIYKYQRNICNGTLVNSEFPPSPLTEKDIHRILTTSIKSVQPEVFVEAGCAVCGRLTPLTQLTPLIAFKGDLSILCVNGVTRKERFHASDPIEELEGPILADGCTDICIDCEFQLLKGKIPKHALANHGWIGPIPSQLQDLKYAECVMIARIRHNRCVMRVNSGRVRMHANAIMFPQPVVKVYHKLPPSKDELSEVLAFIFTGSAAPTEEDFERTPMLVRRHKVVAALEWLKLNHADYADLEISEENIASYALCGVPVTVMHKKTKSTPNDSNPAEARSLDDANEEYGTSTGSCSYAVHALTGSEYSAKSISELKDIAIRHLDRHKDMLGIGRGDIPESMFDNVSAYPGMFPWLFPYGKGGIGHPAHKYKISHKVRKRNLLLYHDKRFQTDMYYPMIAFNQEQMKGSAIGCKLIVKRSKFADISRRLMGTNVEVVGKLADRIAAGEDVKPKTEAEKQCFALLNDLDGIGSYVIGSPTTKKHMRNQIWSTSAFIGAPTWFITASWADDKHPLALYYAQTDTVYRPDILKSDIRKSMMSSNPVSAARFFHYMVKIFIEDVLGWQSSLPGVFGQTNAFYGSVEQQGRLTLHLHMLIWVINALSPQQIRDRIMNKDSVFQTKLIAYLESTHQGEFIHGTAKDVEQYIGVNPHPEPEKLHLQCNNGYTVPTLSLPKVPPPICDNIRCTNTCEKCKDLKKWWLSYEHEIDDIWLRTNIHKCVESYHDSVIENTKKNWRKKDRSIDQSKIYWERRGCLSRKGICKARFPREVFEQTTVDSTGHINLKKLESNLNTMSRIITYFSRCNTDVTSLLSGTAVKAVVSYVSDYVSKQGLKTYQAFASVYDVFEKNSENLNNGATGPEMSKNLMRQMINSMTTKMEIGSPMASLYVLGNPDHYKSHQYVNFSWRPYTIYVKRVWEDLKGTILPDELDDFVTIDKQGETVVAYSAVDDYMHRPLVYDNLNLYEWIQSSTKIPVTKAHKRTRDNAERLQVWMASELQDSDDSENDDDDDFELDFNNDNWLDNDMSSDDDVSVSESIDDDISDWDSDTEDDIIVKKMDKRSRSYKRIQHDFLATHPSCYKNYTVHCDFRKLNSTIPNFLGGALPRSDKGDREYYCMVMLTLFKPWRHPVDLKDINSNWNQVFVEHQFSARQKELMCNFNLRYECNDARDNHYIIRKKMEAENREVRNHPTLSIKNQFVNEFEDMDFDNEDLIYGLDIEMGPKTRKLYNSREVMKNILRNVKWLNKTISTCQPLSINDIVGTDISKLNLPYKSRNMWTEILRTERKKFTVNKMINMPPSNLNPIFGNDKVQVLPYTYFNPSKSFTADAISDILNLITSKWTLNVEQDRAFRLFANHASSPQDRPLRMYLGGMGGTGKSNVFKAIVDFFKIRNEEYRYIIVGPTGSSAALLNGSTYHSVFKIARDNKSSNEDDLDGIPNDAANIAAVNERLRGVEYILLDEVSMLSCTDMHNLACQAAKARNVHDIEFGGMSVLLAGDFGQLPPPLGASLYDEHVGLRTSGHMTFAAQCAVLGKILWHQFTTVVILRQNMRQRYQSDLDEKLRTALINMRYGACTKDDIAFLRSRVVSDRLGHPRLDEPQYRNVSIITAWNSERDVINDMGPEKFAQDTNQQLISFYSIDSLSAHKVDKRRWRNHEQSHFRTIGPKLQQALWDSPPCCTSEHIAGCLKLCVGMPVMIKSNDATELCITKGQETLVVGWFEGTGPANQKVLETLFLKLVNPPRTIHIPGLPENIVPIPRKSRPLTVLLQDDSVLTIKREQVVVLPNFSMTDYGSQGKSRDPNIVHLNNCKTHLSYYVALSRGFRAATTVIVQDFDENKITKGITGHLRQEFRELEILDEITKLRFEDNLPTKVKGIYRRELIRSYKEWKGSTYNLDSELLHPALKYNKFIDDKDILESYDKWELLINERQRIRTHIKATSDFQQNISNMKKESEYTSPSNNKQQQIGIKRKATIDLQRDISKREKKSYYISPVNIHTQINNVQLRSMEPVGLIWDSVNYSCTYDCLFTCLLHVARDSFISWKSISDVCSPIMNIWTSTIMNYMLNPESARDIVRELLHFMDPIKFPAGAALTSLSDLFTAMASQTLYGRVFTKCNTCGYEEMGMREVFGQVQEIVISSHLDSLYPSGMGINKWYNEIFNQYKKSCIQCSANGIFNQMLTSTKLHQVPPIMFIGINSTNLLLEDILVFRGLNGIEHLQLRGLIYHSQIALHYTCIVVDKYGGLWRHDSMIHKRRTLYLGNLSMILDRKVLHHIGMEIKLCAAIYVRC